MEIYNEQVYDLIHWNPKQGKSLPVKWDASYGFYVQGLKVVPCGQMKTLMEVRGLGAAGAGGMGARGAGEWRQGPGVWGGGHGGRGLVYGDGGLPGVWGGWGGGVQSACTGCGGGRHGADCCLWPMAASTTRTHCSAWCVLPPRRHLLTCTLLPQPDPTPCSLRRCCAQA